MKSLLTSSAMRVCDKNTIEKFHMPQLVLMERAALGALEVIEEHFHDTTSCGILCGPGNNGADGVALGRLLNERGYITYIILVEKNEKKYSDAMKKQLEIYRSYGFLEKESLSMESDLIVDALFGTGMSRPLSDEYLLFVKEANETSAKRLALDYPSGEFEADITVTFGFDKVDLHLYPSFKYAGQIIVKDVGISDRALDKELDKIKALEMDDLKLLPKRNIRSNKGSYGKLLVIAGSKGMAGAAYLSAKAAFRMGTGLVRIYTCEENREILQKLLPEAILSFYDSDLSQALEWADALVIGPGLGTTAKAQTIVEETMCYLEKEKDMKAVIDADALNLIAKMGKHAFSYTKQMVLTPHLGEASRLFQIPVKELSENLLKYSIEIKEDTEATLVLKDFRTITATDDGMLYVNLSGNQGMATAGSGDVLTGVIGALLAQGLSPSIAASLGVYLHGLAGDYANKKIVKRSMMAEDIVEGISDVLADLTMD